jgi:hypothetical protein
MERGSVMAVASDGEKEEKEKGDTGAAVKFAP